MVLPFINGNSRVCQGMVILLLKPHSFDGIGIKRSLIRNITVPLATLLLPLINGSTVYYQSRTVKPTPFIWIAHPCLVIIAK